MKRARHLRARIATLDTLGLDDLAILFDDMRGDIPDLATRQARIIEFVAGCTKRLAADHVPVLLHRRLQYSIACSATRPANYLRRASGGCSIPQVQVFWTGEEVCARAFSPGHCRMSRQAAPQAVPVGQLSRQ